MEKLLCEEKIKKASEQFYKLLSSLPALTPKEKTKQQLSEDYKRERIEVIKDFLFKKKCVCICPKCNKDFNGNEYWKLKNSKGNPAYYVKCPECSLKVIIEFCDYNIKNHKVYSRPIKELKEIRNNAKTNTGKCS